MEKRLFNSGLGETRCLNAFLKRQTLFLFMELSLNTPLQSICDSNSDSSVFWLTGVKYLEEKKAVIAEFSNEGTKRTFRFAFFPSMLVSKKAISKEELKQEISLLGNQRFELIELESCFRAVSTNFSFLENLANNIFSSYGTTVIMPEAERQFLIEKNWGFFNEFVFQESEEPLKKNSFEIPNIKIDFFSETLPKTIEELSKIDSQEANAILSLIAFSKALFLPLEKIPSAGFQTQEIFLENSFFKNNFAPVQLAKSNLKESHETQFASFFRGTAELDIAPFVPVLLTNALYNIGFDSLDCECCEPKTIQEPNVLMHSCVEVEFLKDAFYFESTNPNFSHCFHEMHSLKENRLRRKKEFFLNNFPVGPFHRNQKEEIQLQDALLLEQNKEAKILGFKEKHWFCRKKESFLSKIIKSLAQEIIEAENFLEKIQKKCFSSNGILGCIAIEQNLSWQFAVEHKKNTEFFLNNLPAQLSNRESKFFDSNIAKAITATQSSALFAFKELKTTRITSEPAIPSNDKLMLAIAKYKHIGN